MNEQRKALITCHVLSQVYLLIMSLHLSSEEGKPLHQRSTQGHSPGRFPSTQPLPHGTERGRLIFLQAGFFDTICLSEGWRPGCLSETFLVEINKT